jgi:hypothetical protein
METRVEVISVVDSINVQVKPCKTTQICRQSGAKLLLSVEVVGRWRLHCFSDHMGLFSARVIAVRHNWRVPTPGIHCVIAAI